MIVGSSLVNLLMLFNSKQLELCSTKKGITVSIQNNLSSFFFRVIPFLTHHSDIVSDIPSGIISGNHSGILSDILANIYIYIHVYIYIYMYIYITI